MHQEKRGLPVHKWMYSKYKNGGNILVKKIDECSESEWEERERYWIKYYKDLGFQLMNLDKGGKGVITKEKRSKSSLERSIESHKIPIVALYKNGDFYKEYPSIIEATKEFGFKSRSSINNVLKKRSLSSGGFLWVYKKDYNPNNTYKYEKPKKVTIPIYEFNIDGTLITKWESIVQASKELNCHSSTLKDAISNKRVYRDHYWSLNETINIKEYDPYYTLKVTNIKTGAILLYRNQAAICKDLQLSPSVVCTALKEDTIIKGLYKISKI